MRAWIQDSEGIDNLRTDLVAKPTVEHRDLLVRVRAVATNPVDSKIVEGYNWGPHIGKLVPAPNWTVGWDGAAIVEALGDKVQRYQVGDEVYFSGDVRRSGCFAEYCLVDERITGRKPKNLSFEEAAALPLTFLTAWEGLEEGFNLRPDKKPKSEKTLLVVGGAGGVGSAVIQVAKRVFSLKVIYSVP
jgi:NADPH:quinone reductase-like Zn-dependent oxidoreductase